MCPKCPGHSFWPSSQVSQFHWRSIVPKRGSLRPFARGRCRCSSYHHCVSNSKPHTSNEDKKGKSANHCLWIFNVDHTHPFDLLRRKETKLDLLNRAQRRLGVGKVNVRHGDGCRVNRSVAWGVKSSWKRVWNDVRSRSQKNRFERDYSVN